MERFKVAIVCDWFLPRIGGVELHLRDLARELNRRGHEAHIVTATPGPDLVDGIRVHRLGVPLMPGLKTIRNRRSLVPLEQVLRRENFDIVHCHTVLSPLAHAGAFLAKQLGIPSLLTEHSVLRHGSVNLFRTLNHFFEWAAWPDILTAVSSYVADDLRMVTGRGEVFVLPNGINPGEWHARRQEDPALLVTSVMRLTKRKKPVDIVRAIPRVYDQLPASIRPRFVLIGDGPERAHVEREAQRLGVRRHIDLMGFRPRSEIREVLSRSALFILPTSKEAFSIATLEARCVGVPVVAMNHGGVGDVIKSGCEGYLANDAQEFSGYIAKVVQDRSLRQRMTENTRRGLDKFSWEQVIAQHAELYRLACQRVQREPAPLAVAV